MATWIKAGFWEKLCKPCQGYKGWLNLDQFVQDNALPYKVYSALLTQTGTDDPIPTVLQNTLGGDITWERTDIGNYVGTLLGAFPENKTFVILTQGGGVVCILNSLRISDDEVLYSSNNPIDTNPIDVQGLCQIEIRVYN